MVDEIVVTVGSLVPEINVDVEIDVSETRVTNSLVGLTGVKGNTGDNGDQGIQGVKGDVGDQGPPGDDAFDTDLDITVLFENALA